MTSDPSALVGRVTVPTDDDGPDCNVGYAGYFQMPEIAAYSVRYRVYDPVLGRWFQRDPAGYVDGMSLYEYVAGGATRYRDPLGLSAWGQTYPGIWWPWVGDIFQILQLIAESEGVKAGKHVKVIEQAIATMMVNELLWRNGGRVTADTSADLARNISRTSSQLGVAKGLVNQASTAVKILRPVANIFGGLGVALDANSAAHHFAAGDPYNGGIDAAQAVMGAGSVVISPLSPVGLALLVGNVSLEAGQQIGNSIGNSILESTASQFSTRELQRTCQHLRDAKNSGGLSAKQQCNLDNSYRQRGCGSVLPNK